MARVWRRRDKRRREINKRICVKVDVYVCVHARVEEEAHLLF